MKNKDKGFEEHIQKLLNQATKPRNSNKQYDYTKNQNVQDAEKSYEDKVNRQRGIINESQSWGQDQQLREERDLFNSFEDYERGHTERDTVISQHNFEGKQFEQYVRAHEKSNPQGIRGAEYPQEESIIPDSLEPLYERTVFPKDTSTLPYNFTENQNIQDAQKSYEEQVDIQRGIREIYSSSVQDQIYPGEKDNVSSLNKKTDEGIRTEQCEIPTSQEIRISDHIQEENVFSGETSYSEDSLCEKPVCQKESCVPTYDYTKSQTVQDAEKSYEEKVNIQREIIKKDSLFIQNQTYPERKNSVNSLDKKTDEEVRTGQREILNLQERRAPDHIQEADLSSGRTAYSDNLSHTNPSWQKNPLASTYDYTKTQTIADAEAAYGEQIWKKRTNPLSAEMRNDKESSSNSQNIHKTNEYAKNVPVSESLSRAATLWEQSQIKSSDDKSVQFSTDVESKSAIKDLQERRKGSTYDYTKTSNIQDAQKQFEEKIFSQHNKFQDKAAHSDLAEYNSTTSEKTEMPLSREEMRYVSRVNLHRGVPSEKLAGCNINLSELYEKSAKGGERNSDMANLVGASEEDLKTLLQTRGLRQAKGKRFRVAGMVQRTGGIVGTYLYESAASGSDVGQGSRMTNEISTATAGLIVRHSKEQMMKAMRGNVAIRLNGMAEKGNVFGNNNIYIANPEWGLNKKEIKEITRELDNILAKCGIGKIKGSSVHQQILIDSFLRKNKEKLTISEITALKMRKTIAKIGTLEESVKIDRKSTRRKIRVKAMRYIQQSESGLGMVFIYNLIHRSNQTLQLGMKTVMTVLRTAQLSGKLAMRVSAKAAAALAKSRLAQKLAETNTGASIQTGVKNFKSKVQGFQKKISELKDQSRLSKMINAFKERHERFNRFRRDPFSLKKRRKELLVKLKKTKVMKPINVILRPIDFVKRLLGYLLAGMMAFVSALMNALMIMCLMFIILAILVCVISGIVSAIIGLFDFSTNETEMKEAVFAKIKECYEAQNQQISEMQDGRYRSFSIQYETVKDFDIYNKEGNKPTEPFTETTNSAELLCMATVYFDFDLSDAGKDKVVDYIEKLYNGSHLLSVVETPYTYTDEEGKEYTVVDAQATLTTYYFNSLFDCRLTSSSNGILAGTEISEKVWNYFRSLGYSEQATAAIMGNMYQESGMDPALLQNGVGPAAGICQWENYSTKSKRWASLNSFAMSKGKSWTDLQCQLDYLVWELNGGDSTCKSIMDRKYGGLENFKRSTDITWAVEAFEKSFERAGKPNMVRRVTQANVYYNMYKGREIQTEKN